MKEKKRRIILWVLGIVAVLNVGVTLVDWLVFDGVMPTDIRSWVGLLTPFFVIAIAFILLREEGKSKNDYPST